MNYLFASDFHIRKNIPICRIDDFFQLQIGTLIFIADLARKYKAILIIAGDIFHKGRGMYSQDLEIILYNIFKGIEIYFIAGNHDLPGHSMENFHKSSLGVLSKYQNWNHCDSSEIFNNKQNKLEEQGFHFINYGQNMLDLKEDILTIAVLHRYCEKDKLPDYIDNGITAEQLLEKYNYNIFVVGDNHRSFIYKKDNRIVFNCGCITRQSVTEKYYKPCVYLFNSETRKYETILLPDQDPGVISLEHLELVKDRNERIDNFINSMKEGSCDLELSFEKNLEKFMNKNKTDKFVKEKIYNSLE